MVEQTQALGRPAFRRGKIQIRPFAVGENAQTLQEGEALPHKGKRRIGLRGVREEKRHAAFPPPRPAAGAREVREQGNVGIVAVEDDRPVGPDCAELANEGKNPPELSRIDDQVIHVRIMPEEIRAPPVYDGRDPRGRKGFPERADRWRVHQRVADRRRGEDKDSPDAGDVRSGQVAPIEPPDNPENGREKKRDDFVKQVRRSLST